MSTPVNPANGPEKVERTRIPMSLPRQKLAVPDLPGYHLHWMLGVPSRIAQALQAGYEFVDAKEVDTVGLGVGASASSTASTDMGSRVSVVAGADVGVDGLEQRLYLMKIKQEWWDADQAVLEDRNEQVAAALRGGKDVGANPDGGENRYIPEAHLKGVSNLFTRKQRRT